MWNKFHLNLIIPHDVPIFEIISVISEFFKNMFNLVISL